MNTLNVHASMNTLLQIDRHQEEGNRIPVTHQSVNAETGREEAAHRIELPQQPDQAESKNSDSAANKHYRRELPKRKPSNKNHGRRGRSDGAGRFVDFTV